MKTVVEIEWDSPEIQSWLCDDNISIALHAYCKNTKFKVKELRPFPSSQPSGEVNSHKHSGDCTIYASMVNGEATDGICTCGYGLRQRDKGDLASMYSMERLSRQAQPSGEVETSKSFTCIVCGDPCLKDNFKYCRKHFTDLGKSKEKVKTKPLNEACPSCGTPWVDHLGIVGTCKQLKDLREKVKMAVECLKFYEEAISSCPMEFINMREAYKFQNMVDKALQALSEDREEKV